MNESFINFKDAPRAEKSQRRKSWVYGVATILGIIILLYIYNLSRAPTGAIYPVNIRIERGNSLPIVADKIYAAGLVKSKSMLRLYTAAIGADKTISAGIYSFKSPMSLMAVASKIKSGEFDVPLIKATIPEGYTNEDIIERLSNLYSKYQTPDEAVAFASELRTLTNGKQGYLFPETYYFFPDEMPSVIVNKLEDEWKKRVEASGTVDRKVIVMASILEGESKTHDEMKVIAGILYKRIDKGMYLQVDAATSTYDTLGLPSEPISNPGLAAIDAALHPEKSAYYFYLHDDMGVVHYAKTFEEHKKNIRKYLR